MDYFEHLTPKPMEGDKAGAAIADRLLQADMLAVDRTDAAHCQWHLQLIEDPLWHRNSSSVESERCVDKSRWVGIYNEMKRCLPYAYEALLEYKKASSKPVPEFNQSGRGGAPILQDYWRATFESVAERQESARVWAAALRKASPGFAGNMDSQAEGVPTMPDI